MAMPRPDFASNASHEQSGHLRGWLLGAIVVGGLFAAWVGTQLHWGEALKPAGFAYRASHDGKCAVARAPADGELPYVLVRAPSNYDPRHAHPLLLVFSPAGFGPGLTERFTGLTEIATQRGIIVAYVGARPLTRELPDQLATLPAHLARDWCLDASRITLAGHSDGGTLAQVIALQGGEAMAVMASAAGLREKDFADLGCPARADVLLLHGADDDHFPGYGESAAKGWARCLGCSDPPVADAEGCLAYPGCRGGLRLCLHEGSHLEWPERARALLIELASGSR